ncbi:hypothetical protein D3C71_1462040 [compost metagenome]
MVRQADLAAEQRLHVWNRQYVRILGVGGIGACALEQHQFLAAGFASRAHGLVQLGNRCHAGGYNHRLACRRNLADQRQVIVLERRDLERRHVKRH